MSDQEEVNSKSYVKMKDKIDDEYLDVLLKEAGYVSDRNGESTFLTIVEKLLGNKSEIEICLCENLFALATTFVGPDRSIICINPGEAKELFQNEEGTGIVYVTLAHEIGHICDSKKTKFYYEDTLDWRLKAEVKADEIALELMKKMYANPEDILLKQMDRALNKQLVSRSATKGQKDLAVAIHEARKNALLQNHCGKTGNAPE